jgi:uncharacterized damage-inducible protein DinB
MPEGEYDLNRVYWWEKRWRESVRHPQQPKSVIFRGEQTAISSENLSENLYDLIYIGGALGSIHAAVMAQRGYRVLLIERLPFGRMNREWNISRAEFQNLIDFGLFTKEEFEAMITAEYVTSLANYNKWQNDNIIESADKLDDEQRQKDVGAFFGSIQGTLSHLLWGDSIWLDRLTHTSYQASPIDDSGLVWRNWEQYKIARKAMDQRLIRWAETVTNNWLSGVLTYTTSRGIEVTKPIDLLVTHIFNHQTHHRGQVHCLLTQFGVATKDTDLLLLPS